MTRTPCLLVGDGPQEATGLGRIARDLGGILASDESLGIDLLQVGGAIPPVWTAWPHLPMAAAERGDDWGASYCEAIWRDRWGEQPGVLLVVWDPARCYAYRDFPRVQKWCYPAIDSYNRWEGLGGPPGAALQAFDRVIAYGRWASRVVQKVRGGAVSYLPHGLRLESYQPPSEEEQAWAAQQLGPHLSREATLVGCVATNQPRKDLALVFETIATLKERGRSIYLWLHTDELVRAWSVTQLVDDCELQKQVTVTLGTMSDRQLSALYHRCDVTLAPGLGEGFGYPIVESLACGVPVVHGDYGGGAELVPKIEWRFPVRETRRDSVYALTRPVFRAEDAANAIERALDWRMRVGREIADPYCRGSVAHLDWQVLTPRWTAWIRKGL